MNFFAFVIGSSSRGGAGLFLPGAIGRWINMTTGDVETRYKELPTGKKIIAYCS